MAIVQVSRITNRKGLTENLPQLAGAELGWCIDSRRLFIGNGTLQEGAPVIGNTEIITEFSDITALSQYIYKDSAVGYTVQTGPTPSDPVVRTVQAKLDDFADVRDFGAVGDGIADDTAAINRALYQLYCIDNNPLVRRTLYFPAGSYRVTSTIIIPTYAKLVGEGANCSIIYLDDASASAYVARYGDSLQQIGVNIGTNSAIPPRNIEISSMTFQAGAVTDIFLVEDATQCYFDSVNFLGAVTQTDIINNLSIDDAAGVRFSSDSGMVCNQITFDKCRFSGLTYGIKTDEQIKSVTVSNSEFDTLYQGIVLGTGAVINGGATGFRAIGNMFDLVYGEGIIYDGVDLCVSAYNIFYDVGNQYTGNPTTPCVLFGDDNNASLSDMFERSDAENQITPRVEITGGTSTTGTQLQLGRYSRETGRTFALANNQSNQPVFTINTANIKAFRMDYTITRDTGIRTGSMMVAAQDTGDSSQTLSYAEDYTENSNTGVTLSVIESSGTVTVRYTTTNTGLAGTLTYSLAHLA